MKIESMQEIHKEQVLDMMRIFYRSPAVHTDGSEEIFRADVEACVSESPYLEGFVFVQDGALLGYGMIAKSFSTEFGRPCVWIEDLYIKPENRGKGIATAFFDHLQQRFPGTLLRLEVEEENAPAVRSYRKNGFDVLPYLEMKKLL